MTCRSTLLLLALVGAASAHVVSIDVASRADLPDNYERISGTAHFAVDPKLPANQIVSDIDYGPLNRQGEVEFSADVYILRPKDPAKSNHNVIFEVSNRGGKSMLGVFNRAGSGDDLGDQMLMKQGYTIVWLGWEWDVPKKPGLLRLEAPIATNLGRPITGVVRADFAPDSRTNALSLGDRVQIPYPVFEGGSLTVRDTVNGQRFPVGKGEWIVRNGTSLVIENGFEPGKYYEFVYTAKDPVLVGLGPAGIRDLISYLKHGGDPAYSIRRAYAFGVSQSGRFLRKYLYDGFNADEKGGIVFDGMMIHVAGGGMGSFNHRFAQPSRDGHPFLNVLYPTDLFPFTDLPEKDPKTGITGALLARARQSNTVPKIFYTNSSYEYWGRDASLIHTTADALADSPLADTTRIYMFAGGQHGPASKPAKNGTQNLTNPNDYRWCLRALLEAMDGWVSKGAAPPDSVYPHMADSTLVAPAAVKFPAIPGQHLPAYPTTAWRLDFGPKFQSEHVVTIDPPRVSEPYPLRVPQVDADGIDLGGIRMPEVAVPVATYLGWNMRSAEIGAPEQMYSMAGSFIPLPLSANAPKAGGNDPRRPVAARYAGRAEYLEKARAVAKDLVSKRLLLAGDVDPVVARAATAWDFVHSN